MTAPPEDQQDRIPVEDALALLAVFDGSVHTFLQSGTMLVGADWALEDVQTLLDLHGAVLTGGIAAGMGHGVAVVRPDGSPLFLATDPDRLAAVEAGRRKVRCRAAIRCDGSVDRDRVYPDGPEDDATYRPGGLPDVPPSVVCDACYLAIEPFMRMNQDDVPEAADAAVRVYRSNLAEAQGCADPSQLLADAQAAMGKARPGTPYYASASACARMAQAEIDRRLADLQRQDDQHAQADDNQEA